MGLFNLFRSGPPPAKRTQLPQLCEALSKELVIQREEIFLGFCLGLKRDGIDVAQSVTRLEKGSLLGSILQAYQLTCIVGFSYPYLSVEDYIPFESMLIGYVSDGDPECLAKYRERYLDCRGVIDLLSLSLSQDLYDLLQRPTPRETVMRLLAFNAVTLAIMCQAATARFFGDARTERELKSKLRV
jgi:hypothetical protein